jgi:hypothetical protein
VEASAITADADMSGGWRFVGKYATWFAEIRYAGAFDRADGNESNVVEIYEGTDSVGTGSTLIASSASATATHAAQLDENTLNGKTAGTLSTGPQYLGFTTGSGGWVKARANVSGTTPSIASMSVDLVPANAGAFRQSGT